jgi:hypothetical protein
VDVIDIAENNFCVPVVLGIFEPTTLDLVGLRVIVRSSIIDYHPAVMDYLFGSICSLSDVLHHGLVLSGSLAQNSVP